MEQNKNRHFKWIAVIVLIMVVIAVVSFNSRPQNAHTIKVGAIYALSGPSAKFGEISAQGVRDAVKYFEEKNNVKIDLILEDSANDLKQGVSVATKLFEIDKVKFAVVGLSGITNAVAPLADQYKSLLITDAAGYGITKGKSYLLQNFLPSLNDVALQINKHPEWKKVAIIYINDEFGNIWREKTSSEIVTDKLIRSFPFEKTTTDFKTDALKIKDFNPDVAFVVGYGPPLNQVFADLAFQKVSPKLITYLTCTLPGVISDKRFDLNGNYSYEYPQIQNKVIEEWIKSHDGSLSTFYLLGFENTLTVLDAAKANANDATKATKYLKTNTLSGLYGDIKFDNQGVVNRDLVLTKIESNTCSSAQN